MENYLHHHLLGEAKYCILRCIKPLYIGQTFRDVTYTLSDGSDKTVGIRTIYDITERTIDKYGQFFIVPDIELNTYWTNLPLADQEIIDLYHAHGESEQYHSEIKTDMDVERHLTEHAGRLVLSIGKSNRWRYTFKRIYDSFAMAT